MLEDVIRPPESHSSVDLPGLVPVSLFDFTAEEIFFAETLRNPLPPPDMSTSNCSEDTRLSSSSPSVEDSHRNQCPPSLLNPLDIDFQGNFSASLPFSDQFDISLLPPFPSSSSSYEEGSALSYELLPPPEAIELNGVAPVPCAFAAPSQAEMADCLSSLAEFTRLGPMLPPTVLVDQGRAFTAMGSIQVIPMFQSPELELHRERVEGAFASDPVLHPVYSARDLQVLQAETQLVGGSGCGGGLTSDPPALEENGFKVGRYSSEERKQRIHRYMKKRNERNFNKKIKYACRKTLADSRPRVRGRFAKNEEFGDTTASSRRHQFDEIDLGENKEQDLVDSSDIFAHFSGVNSLNCSYPIQSYWT